MLFIAGGEFVVVSQVDSEPGRPGVKIRDAQLLREQRHSLMLIGREPGKNCKNYVQEIVKST